VNSLKVLTYIELSAIALGITPGFSFYLVSIANASSGFGRITSGFLGDKLGAINVSAPMTLVCAIMTYFWPLATTKGSLIAVAVIYGFCSGAYVTLLPVPLVAMGDMHDAGRRTGIAGSAIALGAVAGPPISGFIIQSPDGFKTVSYYAGITSKSLSILYARLNLILLSCRIVYFCGCHTSLRHEIPDAWYFTREVLTFGLQRQIFFTSTAH
jgi:MFS family permease